MATKRDGGASKNEGSRTERRASEHGARVGPTYNINGPVGAVMSGETNNANINQTLTQNNVLMQHLAELERAAQSLSGEQHTEALEYVEALREQATASKPKKALVKKCGEGLKGLLSREMLPLLTTVLTIIDGHMR